MVFYCTVLHGVLGEFFFCEETTVILKGEHYRKEPNINGMMLSQNLTYAAYMVFKLAADGFNLLDFPVSERIDQRFWEQFDAKSLPPKLHGGWG